MYLSGGLHVSPPLAIMANNKHDDKTMTRSGPVVVVAGWLPPGWLPSSSRAGAVSPLRIMGHSRGDDKSQTSKRGPAKAKWQAWCGWVATRLSG
jgi:hypothetical protein